jgi:ketosteroid isomerase-like protein
MDWFGTYPLILHSADSLRVYKAEGGVLVLEYEVHGTVPFNGEKYNNCFCSIVTIKDRKIVHWRDYSDSLSALLARRPEILSDEEKER